MSDELQSTPSIRGFQIDPTAIGNVANSVNLFRGEVDFPLKLVTLTGPNGFDVTVAAMYTSNVQQQVGTWNQTAPTSILGMGWSMPFDMITVSGKVSAAPEDGQFYYVDRGNPRLLTRLSAASAGPWTYALQDYEFWTIERTVTTSSDVWTIIKEDGTIYTFGGSESTQYGALWSSANWVGAGAAAGASAFPLCWNLQSATDTFGNSISYSYLFEDVAVTGNPDVEYTQACYLQFITDAFGRTIEFQYSPKTAAEFAPPLPPAYFNRFEKLYLDNLVIHGTTGATALTIDLSYALADLSNEGSGSNGICTKRYLTGVTEVSPDGGSQPGMQFTYVGIGDDTKPGTTANWGALSSIVYPTGAVASYAYTSQALPVSNCQAPVQPAGGTGQVNVWFGPTYAVVTNCTSSALDISVMTWNGSWVTWPLSESISGTFDASSLLVETGSNFFAVCATNTGTSSYVLYLFGQDQTTSGGWVGATANPYSLEFPYSSTAELMMAVGDSFVVVGSTNSPNVYWLQQLWQNNSSYEFDDWGTANSVTPVSGANIAGVAAVENAFVTVSASGQTVSFTLFATSDLGGFASPLSLGSVTSAGSIGFSAGATYAVVTYPTNTAGTIFDAALLQWDASFATGSCTTLPGGSSLSTNTLNPWPVPATIVDNTVIACGPYLWRFDGSQWQSYTMAGAGAPFVFGTDLVIGTDANGNSVAAQFSPQNDSWSGVPSLTGLSGALSANGTCVTIGTAIWTYALVSGTWQWTQSTTNLASGLTADSIVNAPSFIAGETATGVTLTLLQNGQAVTPNAQPAGNLVASGAFAIATSTAAGSVNLYCVLNQVCAAPLVAFAVSALTIDDGFMKTVTGYAYDTTTAAFDPAGRIAQYAMTWSIPGGASGFDSSSPANCTEFLFLNGLGPDQITYPTCSNCPVPSDAIEASLATALFNGLLAQSTAYDANGDVVAGTTNYWYAVQNNAPVPALYRRCFRTASLLDGVTTLVDSSYDPLSGGLLTSTTYNTLSDGTEETWLTQYAYWYQQYDTAQTLNLLTPVVQTTTSNITGGNTTIVSCTVTTWQDWNDPSNCPQSASGSQWAPYRTYVMTNAPSGTTVTFPDWCNTQNPQSIANWQLTNEVTSRAANGVVLESIDVMGSSQSAIYGAAGVQPQFQTAAFRNASATAGEASYLGFETYESSESWTFDDANVSTANAHTGTACLALPANGTAAGLSTTFTLTPTCGNETYLLTAWVQTQSSGASWSITIGNGSPTTAPIEDTNGEWTFFSQAIETGGDATLSVSLALTNGGSASLLIDDVAFAPLACTFGAWIYDTTYELVTASLQSNGVTLRNVYDPFQRRFATIGPDEVVRSLRSPYASLQGNASFSTSDPNSTLSIIPAAGGILDNFADGQWQSLWTGDATSWSVANGWLTDSGKNPATLTLSGSSANTNYGAAVEVTPAVSGIGIGDVAVRCTQWTATGQSWELLVSGKITRTQKTTLSAATTSPQVWLMIGAGSVVLFYANGQQIFAYDTGSTITGSLTLTADAEGGFANAVVFFEPILSMQYSDGAGRLVQQQQLDYSNPPGASCVLSQTLHDPADPQGRPAVVTRNGLLTETFFGYQSAFAAMNWPAGTMTGTIATQDAADGGYPFTRVLFESSPLARPVEMGLPSAPYAIGASGSSTLQTAYLGVPASSYPQPATGTPAFNVTQTTNQNGNVSYVVRDQRKRVVCTGAVTGTPASPEYVQVQYQYNAAGQVSTITPPTAGATTVSYDFLGRVITNSSPDSGTTQFVWDPAGRLRFMQDANGAAGGWYVYKKYDYLGRLIEDGQLTGTWDAATLQQIANQQPSQPESPQSTPLWRKRISYDGDGTNPAANLVGRPWLLESSSGSGTDADVTEELAYDTNGNILTDALTVAGFGSAAETVTYAYDAVDRVTSIDYGIPVQVSYSYDSLGRLAAVGDPNGSSDTYASYQYDPDGRTTSLAVNGGALTIPSTWLSTGWPLTIGDATSPVALTLGYAGAANGEFTSITRSSTSTAAIPSLEIDYTYDQQGRVTAATSTQLAGALSLTSISYDDNGNLLQITTPAGNSTYSYATNTNQLQTFVNVAGTTTYTYDANGNTTGAAGAMQYSIAYDPVTSLPASVGGNMPISFTYGARNERVLKSSAFFTKLYVHGQNGSPLFEKMRPVIGPQSTWTANVYGPGGLLAIVTADDTYSILTDQEGSTRAVIDSAGTIVAGYDYLPYGAIASQYGSLAGTFTYLYTGQELDRESGLYNYRARLLDPNIGRFLQPDPAGQYASPYIYTGDDPILFVDPTGQMSTLGEVLLDIGLGVVALAGIALAFVTAGASLAITAASVGGALAGGILSGAGIAGIMYTTKAGPSNFRWGQFGESVGIGAAAGAVGGLTGQGATYVIGAALGVSATAAASVTADAVEEGAVAAEEGGEAAASSLGGSTTTRFALTAPSFLTRVSAAILNSVSNQVTSTMLQNAAAGRAAVSGLDTAVVTGIAYGFAIGMASTAGADLAENAQVSAAGAEFSAAAKSVAPYVAIPGAATYGMLVICGVTSKQF